MWARIAIGVVLLVAGAAKVADRSSPVPHVPPVLPWVELLLGALLVAGVGGRVAAVPAAALFAVFTVVMWRRLRAGDPAPCGCFGELSRRPVSYGTVVRNVVLFALALMGMLT